MAVGPTYINGQTGNFEAVEVAESGVSAADLWTALESLGLVVEP